MQSTDLSAVFLDRDGVILDLVHHLRRVEDMKLAPGMAEAIRELNRRAISVIVATNQSAVARGLISEAELGQLHREMVKKLAAAGAKLDAIYYCPHHPKVGIPPYKISCYCRKPAPGMIIRAARENDLDLDRSVLIGDTLSDIEAAARAGVKRTILVRTGYGVEEEARIGRAYAKPDAVFQDAPSAITDLLGERQIF